MVNSETEGAPRHIIPGRAMDWCWLVLWRMQYTAPLLITPPHKATSRSHGFVVEELRHGLTNSQNEGRTSSYQGAHYSLLLTDGLVLLSALANALQYTAHYTVTSHDRAMEKPLRVRMLVSRTEERGNL